MALLKTVAPEHHDAIIRDYRQKNLDYMELRRQNYQALKEKQKL